MTNDKLPTRSAKVVYDVSNLIWSMRLRILELENTLHDCVDTLDDYIDADIPSGGQPIPNKAMRMQTEAKRVLALKEDL